MKKFPSWDSRQNTELAVKFAFEKKEIDFSLVVF